VSKRSLTRCLDLMNPPPWIRNNTTHNSQNRPNAVMRKEGKSVKSQPVSFLPAVKFPGNSPSSSEAASVLQQQPLLPPISSSSDQSYLTDCIHGQGTGDDGGPQAVLPQGKKNEVKKINSKVRMRKLRRRGKVGQHQCLWPSYSYLFGDAFHFFLREKHDINLVGLI
jgi:hypothetical protein